MRKRFMLHSKKRGFTLIEILVSIALIGIIGVSFFSMFGVGSKYIASSGDISTAAFDVHGQIEADIKDLSTVSTSLPNPIVVSGMPDLYYSGEVKTKTFTKNGNNVTIAYYKPYK